MTRFIVATARIEYEPLARYQYCETVPCRNGTFVCCYTTIRV